MNANNGVLVCNYYNSLHSNKSLMAEGYSKMTRRHGSRMNVNHSSSYHLQVIQSQFYGAEGYIFCLQMIVTDRAGHAY